MYLILFSFGLMYQCRNGAIPSRNCSIMTLANWRNSVYVLMEICHQRSKWLGLYCATWVYIFRQIRLSKNGNLLRPRVLRHILRLMRKNLRQFMMKLFGPMFSDFWIFSNAWNLRLLLEKAVNCLYERGKNKCVEILLEF